jgi:hypothetical protein
MCATPDSESLAESVSVAADRWVQAASASTLIEPVGAVVSDVDDTVNVALLGDSTFHA